MSLPRFSPQALSVVFSLFLFAACGSASASSSQLSWPLKRAAFRPTPLHFGLYVTPDPDQNPIDPPERFTGYHVATDFEITSGEDDKDVPVFAICTGSVVYSGFAEGYGGLIAQHCVIDDEEVTVTYGHLMLDTLPAVSDTLTAGKKIALLAPEKSRDSDDNRKHLHIGIHKGPDLVYLGYVQTKEELSDFRDVQKVLHRFGVIAP